MIAADAGVVYVAVDTPRLEDELIDRMVGFLRRGNEGFLEDVQSIKKSPGIAVVTRVASKIERFAFLEFSSPIEPSDFRSAGLRGAHKTGRFIGNHPPSHVQQIYVLQPVAFASMNVGLCRCSASSTISRNSFSSLVSSNSVPGLSPYTFRDRRWYFSGASETVSQSRPRRIALCRGTL